MIKPYFLDHLRSFQEGIRRSLLRHVAYSKLLSFAINICANHLKHFSFLLI
jgi:hypothetical protein